MQHPELPPVTQAHRLAAFELLRMPGLTFTAAMQDDLRRRCIEACAAQLRTREWAKTARRSVVPVRRVRPGLDGHPLRWCTQLAPGPWTTHTQPELL
jgi:hypothetical protein